VEFGLCLCRCCDPPHPVECVHVEGEVVEASVGGFGYGAVGVAVEGDYGIDEIPHFAVGGVEDVCAVFVDVYPFDGLAVDVPSGVGAFVDDEASFAPAGGEVCECGAEQAGAYDEIVVGEGIFHKYRAFKCP
jgi:hypothetical protein